MNLLIIIKMNDTQKNLYSREICSLGLSTMNKLNKLK